MPRASPMAEGQGTGCQEPEQAVKRDGKACAWGLRGLACSSHGKAQSGGGWESGSGLCRGSECVQAGLRNGQAHGASAAGGEGRWPENLQPAWKMGPVGVAGPSLQCLTLQQHPGLRLIVVRDPPSPRADCTWGPSWTEGRSSLRPLQEAH